MEIIRKADALHVDKPDGTNVDYFLFNEYEIHLNEVAPGTEQQWHHHEAIEETVVITEGVLDARWRGRSGESFRETLRPGDLVRVERSVHTFENTSDKIVKFAVFRLVLDGTNKRELIKNDKVVD